MKRRHGGRPISSKRVRRAKWARSVRTGKRLMRWFANQCWKSGVVLGPRRD